MAQTKSSIVDLRVVRIEFQIVGVPGDAGKGDRHPSILLACQSSA